MSIELGIYCIVGDEAHRLTPGKQSGRPFLCLFEACSRRLEISEALLVGNFAEDAEQIHIRRGLSSLQKSLLADLALDTHGLLILSKM